MNNEETNRSVRDEDFERRLSGQPLRQVPTAWREEILSAARAAGPRLSTLDSRSGNWLSTINHQLSTLFWPHRKAWVGLAAVWVVILALNFASRDSGPTLAARRVAPPSPETLQVLKQQERLQAELIGRPELREVDRPKTFPPRPRSQRRDEMLAV